jgi:hypothetical protein
MEILHPVAFSYLRNDEIFNLSNGIKNITANYVGEGKAITPVAERHNTAHEKLDTAMLQTQASALTDQISEADEALDERFLAFRNLIEAHSHRPDENLVNAANRLMLIIRNYGWTLYNTGYSEQTSRLENLIGDMENDGQSINDIAALNASDWLAELKTAFENFNSLVQQRRAETSSKPDFNTTEARKEVKAALNDLFDFIEVMHKVEPEGPYQQLAGEINPIIDEIMQIARSRRSRAENEGEPEETP